jgi:hypothetical protein
MMQRWSEMVRFSDYSSYVRERVNRANSPKERKEIMKMISTLERRHIFEYGLLEEVEEVA